MRARTDTSKAQVVGTSKEISDVQFIICFKVMREACKGILEGSFVWCCLCRSNAPSVNASYVVAADLDRWLLLCRLAVRYFAIL